MAEIRRLNLENKVLRKLFLGFIQIHILHHAKEEAIYGSWMLEELHEHGYEMSAGTLYPILHNMERDQLLIRVDVNINGKIRKYHIIINKNERNQQLILEEDNINGKIRKYHQITERGDHVLQEARAKAYELFKEIK